MNAGRGSERTVSVVGGMALALLIVAVVVQTARAAECLCEQCWPYYQNKYRNDGTTCKQYKDYQYETCIRDSAVNKCKAIGACPNPPGCDPLSGLTDCGSTACNFYPDLATQGVSICSWECWNRACESGGVENQCADRQKLCEGSDGSQNCSECRCNP